MKKTLLTILLSATAMIVCAQPGYFNYQAVVRNAEGNIIANQEVSFKIDILRGSHDGLVVYSETHNVTTNELGMVTLKIFGGAQSGMVTPFSIDWSADNYFIRVSLDANGGNDFVEMGTTQLLTVPYAMYAAQVNADNLPVTYEKLNVTDTFRIGENGINIGSVATLQGITDGTANSVTLDLPAGFYAASTSVLSITVDASSLLLDRTYYGLGYSAAGGTIGYSLRYQFINMGNIKNTITIYYPDNCKGKPFTAVLMKTY